MEYRSLGKTGWNVSSVSFGAWAIGGSWGPSNDVTSINALRTAIDLGVNLVDTADVYGDGHSERLIGRLLKTYNKRIYVITKAGRRLHPHIADGYTLENLQAFADRSRINLGLDTLDLLQLHCPPTEVYHRASVFEALETLVHRKVISYYGVSVETVDEAIHTVKTYPNVQSVQVIFNMFRQKPIDQLLRLCGDHHVGIIARVPLASGLLTGKLSAQSHFPDDDHRTFNRNGQSFDVGETFSGVDYNTALSAVEELRQIIPPSWTLTQLSLRWILMFPEISCVIPGIRTPLQATQNISASDLPSLSARTMTAIQEVYNKYFRDSTHPKW